MRRLRWGEMERSSHVSKELLQREMEMIEQLQVAAKILEGMSESDRLMGVENYRRAEQLVMEVWAEIAVVEPEYVALRQGQPVLWTGLLQCLAYE